MAGIYKKIGDKIAANPDIIRPHVKALDITHLNFKKMKEMGMERVMIIPSLCYMIISEHRLKPSLFVH